MSLRRAYWLGAGALALALGGAACGDDDGGDGAETPDADNEPEIDADNTDAPPELPTGICDEEDDYACPEGGEVRLEWVQNLDPNADPAINTPGMPQARLTGFFVASQTPDYHAFPPIGECVDLTEDDLWPAAVPEDRVYLDIGENLVVTGGIDPIVLDKATPDGTDALLRAHSGPWFYQPSGLNTGDTQAPAGTTFDVFLPGSDEMPTTVYDDALVIPSAFTPTSHLVQFALEPGEDVELTWDVDESDQNVPEGAIQAMAVAFASPGFGPTFVCLVPNTGSFTIPGEIVDAQIALGVAGNLARQLVNHVVREVNNGDDVADRRVDFIAVYCYVLPFQLPPP